MIIDFLMLAMKLTLGFDILQETMSCSRIKEEKNVFK